MSEPIGELVMRTVAMPRDTNANGDMFGGWLVSQMDLGGAILAKKTYRDRVTTVAIDKIIFIKPVRVGDVVSCYASTTRIGNTSMTMLVEVWKWPFGGGDMQKVAEGFFTYVALDEVGKPTKIIK